MHRYRTDKEFSKKVLGKYGKITGRGSAGGNLTGLRADVTKDSAAVAESHPVHDRQSIPGQKAAA
jgi:hypothetical protein